MRFLFILGNSHLVNVAHLVPCMRATWWPSAREGEEAVGEVDRGSVVARAKIDEKNKDNTGIELNRPRLRGVGVGGRARA